MWATIGTFKRAFWMVNIMEMFERLGYYGVRVVIPIYIAQADEIGGLHFSQTDKGIIFMERNPLVCDEAGISIACQLRGPIVQCFAG